MQIEVDEVISKAVPSFSYVSHSSAPHIDRCTHYHLVYLLLFLLLTQTSRLTNRYVSFLTLLNYKLLLACHSNTHSTFPFSTYNVPYTVHYTQLHSTGIFRLLMQARPHHICCEHLPI